MLWNNYSILVTLYFISPQTVFPLVNQPTIRKRVLFLKVQMVLPRQLQKIATSNVRQQCQLHAALPQQCLSFNHL